jgi:hypothetical protein
MKIDSAVGEPADPRPAADRPWRIDVVASTDSSWKWGTALAARLAPTGSGAEVHGHVLHGRATPTDRQIAEVAAAVTTVRRTSVPEFAADPAVARADVVVLASVGGTVQALLHGLSRSWSGLERRPVVITGYVGLVYERMVEGLLLRAGADVVLANSRHDAQRFREVYDAVGARPETIMQTALPFLGGAPYDASAAGAERRFTVCFVVQPSVPPRRDERRYLIERLASHARLHPERDVLVKLRTQPGEQTPHAERHHYSGLVSSDDLPPNMEFVYGSMADVLDRTDLCVTVSSTAALEAMHRGIPTAVLTDFGIRETLGNHQFLRSGTLTSWAAIDNGALPKADPDWLAENGLADPDPYAAARERVAFLVGAPLTDLAPWYDPVIAACLLPRLLARAGLLTDRDATEAVAPAGPLRAVRRRTRRFARRGARTVYRLSLRHIEPKVRRWAQL